MYVVSTEWNLIPFYALVGVGRRWLITAYEIRVGSLAVLDSD